MLKLVTLEPRWNRFTGRMGLGPLKGRDKLIYGRELASNNPIKANLGLQFAFELEKRKLGRFGERVSFGGM